MAISSYAHSRIKLLTSRGLWHEKAQYLESFLPRLETTEDWAFVASELAATYWPALKNSSKAADYALIAGRSLISLGRLAPSAALLTWLKSVPNSEKEQRLLESWISQSFSKKPPQKREPAKEISLFSELTSSQTKELLAEAQMRDLTPHEVLFREGQEAVAFYIVASGTMEMTTRHGDRRFFKEGSFFGEIALFAGIPRTATLTAKTPVKLLVFSRSSLQRLFLKIPPLKKKVQKFFQWRLFLNSASHSTFFRGFGEEELEAIFAEFHTIEIPTGRLIIDKGDQADRLFLLLQGFLEVSDEGEILSRLGPGQFVGEIALLKKKARTARVKSMSTCLLLECEQKAFGRLTQQFPELKDRLNKIADLREKKKTQDSPLID